MLKLSTREYTPGLNLQPSSVEDMNEITYLFLSSFSYFQEIKSGGPILCVCFKNLFTQHIDIIHESWD